MLDFDFEDFLAKQQRRCRRVTAAWGARIAKRQEAQRSETLDQMLFEEKIGMVVHTSGRKRPPMDAQGWH